MRVTVVVDFKIPNGLPIDSSAVGGTVTVTSGPPEVLLELPSHPVPGQDPMTRPSVADSFRDTAAGYEEPAFTGAAYHDGDDNHIFVASVIRLTVSDECSGLNPTDFTGEPTESAIEAAKGFLGEGAAVLDDAAARVLEWLRVKQGQYWIGMAGDQPIRYGPPTLIDPGAGLRFPAGLPLEFSLYTVAPGPTVLDEESLQRLRADLGSASPRDLARSLHADALYIAVRATQPKPTIGLILAAIALEVGAKVALRRLVQPEASGLLEFALNKPRKVELAATDHFHELMRAVGQPSLTDSDPDLWKDVQRLFEVRNRIVHRGESPTDDEATALVVAAGAALDWLDQR